MPGKRHKKRASPTEEPPTYGVAYTSVGDEFEERGQFSSDYVNAAESPTVKTSVRTSTRRKASEKEDADQDSYTTDEQPASKRLRILDTISQKELYVKELFPQKDVPNVTVSLESLTAKNAALMSINGNLRRALSTETEQMIAEEKGKVSVREAEMKEVRLIEKIAELERALSAKTIALAALKSTSSEEITLLQTRNEEAAVAIKEASAEAAKYRGQANAAAVERMTMKEDLETIRSKAVEKEADFKQMITELRLALSNKDNLEHGQQPAVKSFDTINTSRQSGSEIIAFLVQTGWISLRLLDVSQKRNAALKSLIANLNAKHSEAVQMSLEACTMAEWSQQQRSTDMKVAEQDMTAKDLEIAKLQEALAKRQKRIDMAFL